MTKDNLDVTEAMIEAGRDVLDAFDGPSIRPSEADEMLAAIYLAMQYARNEARAGEAAPCPICGKDVPHWHGELAVVPKPASPPTGDCCMQSPCIVDGGCVLLRCVQNRIATLQPAMTKDKDLDVTEALLALAHFNIPPDVQELLVHGNPDREVPPGALEAAMQSAREPKPASPPTGDVVEALRVLRNAVAETLDKDFGFWSSPSQAERRTMLYRAWKDSAALATLQPAKENSYERSIAAASTDDLDEIEPVVSGLRAYAQGRLLVLSLADLRVAARHAIATLQPADPVEPKGEVR